MAGQQPGAACPTCRHFACICAIERAHDRNCAYRVAATCAVGIECRHGRDVCPICDPCECGGGYQHKERAAT